MAGTVCRQPNGLLCRYSSIADEFTDYNMTDEEYIELCAEKARKEAKNIIKNYLYPYETLKRRLLDEDIYVNKAELEKVKKIFAYLFPPIISFSSCP